MADQVDNTSLDNGLGESGIDGLRETLQSINDGNQDIGAGTAWQSENVRKQNCSAIKYSKILPSKK